MTALRHFGVRRQKSVRWSDLTTIKLKNRVWITSDVVMLLGAITGLSRTGPTVYTASLDEVTLLIDFITAFVLRLHVPRCWYLQRCHKNSQIYIDAKHEYEKDSHACEM